MKALLDVRALSIWFGQRQVVRDLNFVVHEGERLALVGESGSGKSVSALTLLRLIPGVRTEGEAIFDGVDLLAMPERQLRGVRGGDIAVVFQEPMTALNPLYCVGDQIGEVLQLKQGLSRAQARRASVELLSSTGITAPDRRVDAFPHQLSGGQRQRVMIAMALASKPRLLLADEPTTALDVTVREQILMLLGDLQREHGMAVMLISHDLHMVRRFADSILVMQGGHLVETGPVDTVFGSPKADYTRHLLQSRPKRNLIETPDEGSEAAEVLSGKDVGVRYPVPLSGFKGWFRKGAFQALSSVDLSLRPGRTLGVVGESGSGKSTLALAALGLINYSGSLTVKGADWRRMSSFEQTRALRRRMQVVFQDPFSSLSPRMTVEDIVGEGLTIHRPELSGNERRERVLAALMDVGLSPDSAGAETLLYRYPHEFSGGQRQRLAIARALVVEPDILVLDEPTSALDVTVQRQVLSLLQRLQRERGLSYLLITHDMDVVRAMAHDVLVLRDGRVVESGDWRSVLDHPKEPYTQALVKAASGDFAPGALEQT